MRFILKSPTGTDQIIDPPMIHQGAQYLWIGEELWVRDPNQTMEGERTFYRAEKELVVRFRFDEVREYTD